MKISYQWLKEFCKFDVDVKTLSDKLTMAGLEVESAQPIAPIFDKVITAHIVAIKKHPKADRLNICDVAINEKDILQIVCGAPNARLGLKVALALTGAKLPHGIEIKDTSIRDVDSCGMLCSFKELGIEGDANGIIELDADAPIGVNFSEYYNLDDIILDINITPNRGDCLSMLGIAREVCSIMAMPAPKINLVEVSYTINEDDKIPVNIKSDANPIYSGRIIRDINMAAKIPLWMQLRLNRLGINSINPVVDILNYVMLELGQPMHAFDFTTIEDNICVRKAATEEKLELLNKQTIALQNSYTVIADSKKPLALAGIMGGLNSSVNYNTKDIFIESAYFKPVEVANALRYYGLNTDSAQRYERGVDFNLSTFALDRATELLLAITGGHAGGLCVVKTEEFNEINDINPIEFDPSLVKKLIGIDLSLDRIKDLLQQAYLVVDDTNMPWSVSIPSYRFDLKIPVDLVEEVVRLHGYEHISCVRDVVCLTYKHDANSASARQICAIELAQDFWMQKSYNETINYSFVDNKLQSLLFKNIDSLALKNPVSSELSHMRVSLWPGLLKSMQYNLYRQQTTLKLFETGIVFDISKKNLLERPAVAALVTGKCGEFNWSQSKKAYDFFDLKGEVQALLSLLNFKQIEFKDLAQLECLHPGKSATIFAQGKLIGYIGVLHPKIQNYLDANAEVILFELYLDTVQLYTKNYKPISKYPQIRRDLSFIVDQNISYDMIKNIVKENIDSRLLRSIEIFDIYYGAQVGENKKSMAISLVLQDDNKTLNDEEINKNINNVTQSLKQKFNILLRE